MERQLALYDPLAARFVRVCVACGQHMLGRSYRTFYGVYVRSNGERAPVCGEAIHTLCPAPGSPPREIFHDPAEIGKPKRHSPNREIKAVSKGVTLITNGRYGARVGSKRLGTYKTQTEAEQARDLYIAEKNAGNQRKRKQAEQQ